MKYLSLVLFAALFVWTWQVIHQDSTITFETHSGIQEKLANLIVENVKTKRPQAKEVIVDRVWTEVVSASQVQAHFIYSYREASAGGEMVLSRIQGDGLLERQGDKDSDHWKLVKVQTNNDSIVFEDGLVVTPDSTTPAAEPAPENPNHESTK